MLSQQERTNQNGWMENLARAGRCFYGIGIIFLGIQQFIYADFRPVFLPEWPLWLHKAVWAYITGAGLVVAGVIILVNKGARKTALILGGFLFLFFIAFHVPYQLFIIPYSFHWGLWTNALKELALSGGAFLVAGSLEKPSHQPSLFNVLEKFIPAGRIFFSITLIVFGMDHFLYTEFVAKLVPSWIPWPVFWTYFAAVALIGSGIAIIFRIMLKQVALLVGTMLFLWLILLHIPRAIADPHIDKGNEVTSVFQALAFSGMAFIIAGMYKTRKQL